MKFQLGDKVVIDIGGTPRGEIVSAYDGNNLYGDPYFTSPVQQSYQIFGYPSYAIIDDYGASWVAHEPLIRLDNFLARLLHSTQTDDIDFVDDIPDDIPPPPDPGWDPVQNGP